jgi:hypothetical protein
MSATRAPGLSACAHDSVADTPMRTVRVHQSTVAPHRCRPDWRDQPERTRSGSVSAIISPLFVGLMFARPSLINLPFFIAGTLKIAYDLLLYREFVAIRPPPRRVELSYEIPWSTGL